MEDFERVLRNTIHPSIMIHSIESIEFEVEEDSHASIPILRIQYKTVNGDEGRIILFFNHGKHIKKNIHAEISKVQKMRKFKNFISNITRIYARTKKEE